MSHPDANRAPVDDSGPIRPEGERLAAVLRATVRPYITLKAATTLDGRIATRTGESRWITGPAARAHGHRLRAGHDGILVGIRTVLADDPQLTVRPPAPAPTVRQPARVVLDSRARIDPAARCLANDGTPRIVVVGRDAPAAKLEALRAGSVHVIACPTARPEPACYLPALRKAGISTLLVEGGAQVHANLIARRVADALFLYMAGLVFGDEEAPGWCAGLGIDTLAAAPGITLAPPQTVGTDVLLHGLFAAPVGDALPQTGNTPATDDLLR